MYTIVISDINREVVYMVATSVTHQSQMVKSKETLPPQCWNVPVVKRESCGCGDIDGGGASLVPGRQCQSYLQT